MKFLTFILGIILFFLTLGEDFSYAADTGKIKSKEVSTKIKTDEKIFPDTGTLTSSTGWYLGIESNSGESTEEKNESDNEDSEEISKKEKEEVKNELNTLIIDFNKAKLNRIIKDLDTKLQKVAPDIEERKIIYKKLLQTYKLRRNKVELSSTNEIRKTIILGYLDYIIDSFETKIEQLNEK